MQLKCFLSRMSESVNKYNHSLVVMEESRKLGIKVRVTVSTKGLTTDKKSKN